MTESPDDKALVDYMGRDSAVSRAYRDMDTADIPSDVDAAVLAQARAAVDRQQAKRRPAWTRWSAPVALAASVVIGVAVLLEVGVEEKVYYPAARDEPAQSEAEQRDATVSEAIEQVKEQPAVAPSAPAPVDAAKQSQLKAERALARKQEVRADAAPAAGAAPAAEAAIEAAAQAPQAPPEPSAVAAEAAPSADSASTRAARPFEADELKKAQNTSGPDASGPHASGEDASGPDASGQDERGPASLYSRTRAEAPRAPAPVAQPTMADRQVGQLSSAAPAAPRLGPEAWLEQIRLLRREGKVLEADEQWRRFSAAYPEVVVPEDDFARPTR